MAVFSISRNRVPFAFISVDKDQALTPQDALRFVSRLTDALLNEEAALEASAQRMGRTQQHELSNSVGSIELFVPKIFDKTGNVDGAGSPDSFNNIGS